MAYCDFVSLLQIRVDGDFALFQRKLIPTKQSILGVRTPVMRTLARAWRGREEELLSFPDEFYEVTFIKLCAVSALPFEKFCFYVYGCVSLIDNWATCDSFKAPCVKTYKEEFLPYLDRLFARGGEFDERYVLVTLLMNYIEDKYFPLIRGYLAKANCEYYNVHMAAAWLVAEVLTKAFDEGVEILKSGILPKKTHNKAIQKAKESYRITAEQKGFLRSLKI